MSEKTLPNLKVGDIKQFELAMGGKVVTGIWCGQLRYNTQSPFILTLDGAYIPIQPNTLKDAKAVRLNPEIRANLEAVAMDIKEAHQLCVQQIKLSQQILKLTAQVTNMEQKAGNKMKAVRKSIGVMSPSEFGEYIKSKIPRELQQKFEFHSSKDRWDYRKRDYRIEYELDRDGVFEFCAVKTYALDKYASPDKYQFLYEEYDRTLFVNEKHPDYATTLKKLRGEDIPIKNRVGGLIDSSTMWLADKDFLHYTHRIGVQANIKKFSRDEANKLLEKFISIFM